MLIAPFTWPFANALGPRTSTTIKSGLADFRLSCTSQQSVSNASISWKCLMATSEGAAVVSVTCVVMVGPFGYLYRQAISPETHLAYKLDPRMSRLGPFSDMQNGPG